MINARRLPTLALCTLVFALGAVGTLAENLFVTPTGAGAQNGSSWANAWSRSQVIWGPNAGQVGAGDTLWFAGGTYTGSFQIGASGTPAARIFLKRATVSNPECTSSPGWSLGFDSQVVWDFTGTLYGISCAGNVQHWITIDGQVLDGIKMVGSLVDNSFTAFLVGHSITVRNVRFAGNRDWGRRYTALQLGWTSFGRYTNGLVQNVKVDGYTAGIYVSQIDGITIERCQVYDNLRINKYGADPHPDAVYITSCFGGIYRFNTLSNCANVGLYFTASHSDNWQVYGNVFNQFPNAGDFALAWDPDLDTIPHGPNWWVYNNTFANCWNAIRCVFRAENPKCILGGRIRNNLFYNAEYQTGTAPFNSDYNWFSQANAYSAFQPHAVIGAGVNPFSDAALHIVGTTGLQYPRQKGEAEGAPYDIDMDGIPRGATIWDIGAYAFATGFPPPPPPPPPAGPPSTPVNVTPANGTINVPFTPTLTINSYNHPDNVAQADTQFRVLASDGLTLINDSGSKGLATSYTVPAAVLSPLTIYRWQARVKDANGNWSQYSAQTTMVTTNAPTPPPPVISVTNVIIRIERGTIEGVISR